MNAQQQRQSGLSERSLILLLASITAIAPLAMQMYLPALPGIAIDLFTSASTAQLTFSAFVFTVGPAQLLYGPIADHFGRRFTTLGSLALCLIGSIGCVFAPDIYWLIAARVVQAFGSAGGMVVTRAILSDRYGHEHMASRLSSVIVVIVVVPMLAPLLGGYMTSWFGWRSIFLLTAIVTMATLLLSHRFLPETRIKATHRTSIATGAKTLLRRPLFLVYTLQTSLSLAVFYSFIAVVPHIMENVLALPPTAYGEYFIFLAAGYLLGNILSSRFATRVGIRGMIAVGASLGFAGGMTLALLVFNGTLTPWSLFGPMIFMALANGMATPSMQSGAVLQSPDHAGTASGILGCTQQLAAGIAAQSIAMISLSKAEPLVILIAIFTSITLLAAIALFTPALKQSTVPTTRAGT